MKTSLFKSMILIFCSIIILFSCEPKQPTVKRIVPQRKQPKKITYHFESAKQWMKQNRMHNSALEIAFAVNRTDSTGFEHLDSVIIPDDMSGDLAFYLPFPLDIPYLQDVDKIIFFSYPTQTFAAYERGILNYTGPTNMGRKKDPTPTGLFYTNWKAEQTTSTFNDEWDLHWNFNIENKEGIGWHQYSLPGYPASHSCLRLQEKDAAYLYNWANEWQLKKDSVVLKGTPVIVFGTYNFEASKPWLLLINNANALAISAEEIQKQTATFLPAILAEQKKRNDFEITKE
jgi:hypothetical protein